MTDSPEKKAYYCPSCRCTVGDFDQYCPSCETGKPPLGWPEDVYIGRIIGQKYRIEKRISSGGFGIIFLATHLHQDQEIGKVIIKMLHPEHCFEPTIKKRFINEAKAARTINNPHVVKIFDLNFDKAMVPYMVQEYVEGRTLINVLEINGKLDLPRAVNIAIQIAEGMKESHDKGILHRDLKPENIILQNVGKSDFVKLIDFGIARLQTQSSLATASFIGTPRYMSPEQIQGQAIDKRSDIFSLGVILFEMVSGHPPIETEASEIEYLNLNLQKEPRKIIDFEPAAPETLSRLVDSMLKKEPDSRPPDMENVIVELVSIAEAQGWKADYTGSYRLSSLTGKEDTETAVDPPFHQLKTEVLPPGKRGRRQPDRKIALILLAGGIVSVLVVLAVLVSILLSGENEISATEGGTPVKKTAGKADRTTALSDDAQEESVRDTFTSPAPDIKEPTEEAPQPEQAQPEKPPQKPPKKTAKKKKKGKKKKGDPWTKI